MKGFEGEEPHGETYLPSLSAVCLTWVLPSEFCTSVIHNKKIMIPAPQNCWED